MTSASLRGLLDISKGFGIQDRGRSGVNVFGSLPHPMHTCT